MGELLNEHTDFVDEDHIAAFAKALSWEYDADAKSSPTDLESNSEELQGRGSLIGNNTDLNHEISHGKPTKIASKSDWIPIHKKLRKKSDKKLNQKKTKNEYRSSYSFMFLRWPILIFTLMWIAFLSYIYLLIRLYVASYEYFVTWRGERRRLREVVRAAKNYEEWISSAKDLDSHLDLDSWKEDPKFYYYDYKTLEITIARLRKLRMSNRTEELATVLHGCIKSNFAGIENLELYTQCYYGTKNLVIEYVDEAVKSLNHLIDSDDVPPLEKRRLFKIMSKNFGKTALCLSGGASFAYSHIGIIKALLDNDLLPNIISGTSGGGLIAALACTRTSEELKQVLIPQLSRKLTACEEPFSIWFKRWWKTGARFDSVDWAKKATFFTFGDLTFQEAFKRTGRKLNISTVPADPHSPSILCNNITSPNCVIWSSLLASSAVPGILNPVVLMMKDKTNRVVPFSFGSKWRDGSLRTDIPVEALNTYFNVKFSIVSQVNPHIALFFYAPKGQVGRPVSGRAKGFAGLRGGFIGAALEHLVKLEVNKWLKLMKSLDLFPHLLDQDWSSVWLQRFSGTITLWPKVKMRDFLTILSDPTEDQLRGMIKKGEASAYPKLLFIKNRLRIERVIEKGRRLSRPQFGNDMSGLAINNTDQMVSDTSINLGNLAEHSNEDDIDSDSDTNDSSSGDYVDADDSLDHQRSETRYFYTSDDYDESNDADYIPSDTEEEEISSDVDNSDESYK